MKFVFIIFSLMTLSACSLNQNIAIKGVDMHSFDQGKTSFVDLETIVSLGNLKLPNSNISIKNPEEQEIGEVSVQHLDDGTSRVALRVNYEEMMKVEPTIGKTLPNGSDLSTILGNKTPLIGINILKNSRVYVGGNINGTLYAGVALNLPAFDHILSQMPMPLNQFRPVWFSKEVMGNTGIFSSPQKGQNGIAIFAKKTNPSKNEQISFNLDSTAEKIKKLDSVSLVRLNYLFNKHAILSIK